ncbi:MAG: type II toxin-antitoxin system RelE/ParE family toxin [Deltaproteobacteria bacterium]|nr:type II toxin-antitoxin system RelE/ParE family toxin [Deltaproteobacteria bacterium]
MSQITEVTQSPLFARQKKKLKKNQIKKLDDAIKTIMANPAIGTAKSGDLQGVQVYKYKIGNNLILLAYEVNETTLYLYTFGSHQNFYRELSKYLHQ